jgi:hypothetical protein
MTKTALWLPVLAVAATAYWSKVPERALSTAPAGPRPGRPECPHDWDFKGGQMAAVGPTINVPEFHDCQRFIVYVHGEPRYDSLYAIFATDSLAMLDTMLAQLDTGETGSVALAAAEVYAEGIYPLLGIRTPFSCLYLFRVRRVWHAKMVSVGRAEYDCSQPINPTQVTGTELEVRPEQLKDFYDSDYPPVARWDWDPEHHQQYIGIKCGAAWCEVGASRFVGTRHPDLPLVVPPKLRRTRMIKGWYDQQFLASTSPSGEATPSRIWGTIYPDSGLNDYDTIKVFKRGIWVSVAQVALEDLSGLANPPNPYKKRMNLDFTHSNGRFNTIYLCHGNKGECEPTVAAACDGDGLWWGKVEDATPEDGSPALFMCTVRRPHDALGYHVPGTARWRWLASDETTWKRCDAGCCELH